MQTRIYLYARDRSRRWALASLGQHSGLDLSWTWPGGSDEASWEMDLPPAFRHPALRRGALVEVQIGPEVIWVGHLIEPDAGVDGWTLTAQGSHRVGGRRLCLDALGNSTTTPDTAIDAAIARGLQWTRPTSLSATPLGPSDSTRVLNRLGELLTGWADDQSKRWAIDTDWTVFAAADPTTPTWYMTPGSGAVGLADDEYASDLYVRYQESALAYATVHVGDSAAADEWDTEEEAVEVIRRGIMTSGQATTLGTGLLALGKPRLAWTAPVEPASRQITRGEIPACLPMLGRDCGRGRMVRLKGITNPLGVDPWTDFVVGRARWAEDTPDAIQLAPTQLAARNMREAMGRAITTATITGSAA